MLLQVVKLKRGFAVCASEQLMDSLGQRCFLQSHSTVRS